MRERRVQRGHPSRDRPNPGTLTSLIEEVVRGTPASGTGEELPRLSAGLRVGRYELVREIGRGGFGVVWEARDQQLGRTVAFKALHVLPGAPRERRLIGEAEVAARLSHRNIVTVLDVGKGEHGVYLIQEYLPGVTLARRLEEGPLSVRDAVHIGAEVAEGLAHAHAHGVVHRDLKPDNIQVCDDGQVKILDLGMASALGRRKVDGGTRRYMAPEQVAAAPEDERTDVYALGVLLFEMLTGKHPGEAGGVRQRALGGGLSVPSAPALGTLVEAMLSDDPTHRPRDAGVVVEVLREIEASLPVTGSPSRSRARVRPAPRFRWVLLGVAGTVLAVAGVAIPWKLSESPALPTRVHVAASSVSTPCRWHPVLGLEFSKEPPGATVRNGKMGSQGPARQGERWIWKQASDWNQLFVPLGNALPDFFAVQADFLMEPIEGAFRGLSLTVFTDPAGPDPSEVAHGRSIRVFQDPGRNPGFEWGLLQGKAVYEVAYKGALASSISGGWRRLRIEGSRSQCWMRALLDGVPIMSSVGDCDLSGRHVLLGSASDSYRPADVAWRDLMVFEGGPDCR